MQLGVNELCPCNFTSACRQCIADCNNGKFFLCSPLHGHASWTLQLPCVNSNLILHKRCNESPETTAKSSRCNGEVLCMELVYHAYTVY